MAKLTSQQKRARLKKKADRLLQEIGRELYDRCLVCGKPYTCLHHYYPKSLSSVLRYDWDNCIPICQSCHFEHHTKGNPDIHNKVNEVKGKEWLADLKLKKKTISIKESIGYYENIINNLKTIV